MSSGRYDRRMIYRPAYTARERRELEKLTRLAKDGVVPPYRYAMVKRLILDGLSAREAVSASRGPRHPLT